MLGSTMLTRRRRWGFEAVVGVMLVATVLGRFLPGFGAGPRIRAWSTITVAIFLQALPFLVLGVLLGAVIAVFTSPERLRRLLPSRGVPAVLVGGSAGLFLPGCECASVPVSGRLMAGGVPAGAALAFMLSAPAINPVVLVATAVAFPGRPEMVVGRFVASLAVAVLVGLVVLKRDPAAILERVASLAIDRDTARWRAVVGAVRHDVLQAGGYLVVGASVAAAIQVLVPPGVLRAIGGVEVVAVLAMATLAVVLSICSEADAFIAAGFTQMSPTAQLTFMVVGPVVDLKLVSMQVGVFGRRFAGWFAPTALVVAIACSVVVGWWL